MAIIALKNESPTKQCRAPDCNRGARSHGLCGKHYQRWHTYGSLTLPPKPERIWATCGIDGCSNRSRSVMGRLCEMHYGRMRRNGNYDAPVWGKWGVTEHGYVMRRDLEHPISSRNGYLYQHRAVLWDKIGDGCHSCYWCGAEIEWMAKGKRKLVVDHLDGDKQNNEAGNLVPSCHRCNASRGLFQAWVMKHRDDPFLWSLYQQARAA